jgi:hypothetical protein
MNDPAVRKLNTGYSFAFKQGSAAFPLNELFIAAVLLGLIAAALFFFGGAGGVALLWGLGVLLLLPLVTAPIGLFLLGVEKSRAGQRGGGAAFMLGALLAGAAWLAAIGYCAYRGYLAIP